MRLIFFTGIDTFRDRGDVPWYDIPKSSTEGLGDVIKYIGLKNDDRSN